MSATYPRRWLVAIVFASIVALTAGSFTDVWAASPGGTTGGSLPSELATVELDVDTITVSSGGGRTFVAVAKDVDGDAVSGVTITYSTTGGTITNDGIFVAPTGPAIVTVTVTATQGSLTAQDTATVTVNSPPAPKPAPVIITNPPPPTAPVEPSFPGIQQVERLSPESGGTVSLDFGDEPDLGGQETKIVIVIPPQAVDKFVDLKAERVLSEDIPPVPSALRIKVSGSVVDLTFTDAETGLPIVNFVANKAITITMSYTQADADAAGGAQNLVIMKFDKVTQQWSKLATTVNLANMTMSASVKSFSLFGVGIPEVGEPAAPSATATPVSSVALPATGDVAPGNGAVIAFTMFGLLLLTGGITVIWRRQTARSRS